MDRFYNINQNIKQSRVNATSDILRLVHVLQQDMEFCFTCQSNHKADDLISLGSKKLRRLVQKFNAKMCTPHSLEEAGIEETNALDIDVADAVGEAHDKRLATDELDDMFAAQN